MSRELIRTADAWNKVKIARDPNRPNAKFYINEIKFFYIIVRIFSVSDRLYNRKFFYISIWTKFPFFFPEDFFPIIVFLHFRIQFVL